MMLSLAKKQIDSPTLYQGLMLVGWKYTNCWKSILRFDTRLKRHWFPLVLIGLYLMTLYYFQMVSSFHINASGIVLLLYYYNRASNKLIRYYSPIIALVAIYNLLTLYRPEAHHTLFGIQLNTISNQSNPMLTKICSYIYAGYAIEFLLFSLFLYGANLYLWVKKLNWSFFVANLLGLAVYSLYSIAPGESALATLPSLQLGSAFVGLFAALQIGRFKAFSTLWLVTIVFASQYLGKQYPIEILFALLYALIGSVIVEYYFKKKSLFKSR